MENDKTINPELILASARMVRPDIDYAIYPSRFGGVVAMDAEFNGQFSPEHDNADAFRLEERLERDGWMFKYNDVTDSFTAEKKMELVSDLWVVEKTKALRALACASAQSGIPMYVGGGS